MKKVFILILTIISVQFAYAANSAKIKINIAGAFNQNKYFLCLPNLGCLSIKAAQKGKVYSIFRPVEMNTIFVMNTKNFHAYSQGLPESCNVTVGQNQTLTIYGKLMPGPNNSVKLNQLRCTLS